MVNVLMKKCGDFLRKSRENQKLSQSEVSSHLGYSTPQFISNWERGVSQPPVVIIKTLAKLYKIDAEVLFNIILDEQIEATRKSLRQKFMSSSSKGLRR